MKSTEGIVRQLEDDLQRRASSGTEYATLAQELAGLLGWPAPTSGVVKMVHRSDDRRAGPRRERDRRVRRQTEIETYESRDLRLADRRMTNPPWLAAEVRKRLDVSVDTAGQSTAGRDCPVCLRRFSARADRATCSDHCRDLARRIRQADPTAEASLRMLFEPPACAGCGEPLWAKRPDAKQHGPACVKRRQRSAASERG